MQAVLTLHSQRALHRVAGLTFLNNVLGLISFGSARQQVLSGLRPCLASGSHYLDRVEACGRKNAADVERAFGLLLQQLVVLVSSSSSDLESRLSALEVFSMRFRCFDAGVLSQVGVLRALMSVIVETSPSEVALGVQPMEIEDSAAAPGVAAVVVAGVAAAPGESSNTDSGKVELLRKASWMSFRLVATQAINWGTDDIILNPSAVEAVRRETFVLLAKELRRLGSLTSSSPNPEEREQLVEVLSLAHVLLLQCASGVDVLVELDSLSDLVLVLQADSTPPECKRLSLRLVRKLLPKQPEASFRAFMSLCFGQIGRWLLGGLADPSKVSQVSAGVAAAASSAVASAGGADAAVAAPAVAAALQGSTPSQLFVLGWTAGASRVFEELFNNVGQEFLSAFSGGVPNSQPDAVVRRLMDEMSKSGRALLFTGPHDDCVRYTKLLGQFGCTLMVSPVSSGAPAASAVPAVSPPQEPQQYPWTSGHAALALASQYVSLVRSLAADSSHPHWARLIQQGCVAAMADLLAVDSGLAAGSVQDLSRSNILAALCVVGGFTETLRIGSKVEVSGEIASSKTGTLVKFSEASDGTAFVVLDQDVSRSLQKFAVSSLTPVPEHAADPELLPLSPDILAHFLKLLQVPVAAGDTSFCAFLRADLRARCMQALASLVRSQTAANLFLNSQAGSSAGLDALMSLARACEPSWVLSQQDQHAIATVTQLWDSATRPPRPSALFVGVRSVSQLLPNFPFSGSAAAAASLTQEIFPTCLDVNSVDGAVFFGTDFLEVMLEPQSGPGGGGGGGRGGRRGGGGRSKKSAGSSNNGPNNGERLVLANAPVPDSCTRHYWEIEVVSTKPGPIAPSANNLFAALGLPSGGNSGNGPKDGMISVGLAPVGSRAWGDGSYCYQSDSKKMHFVDGVAQRNNFGHFVRAKSVVGCLWDKEEKTITFSHNGASLGTAFTQVVGERLVPCIGLSSGVQVKVNFGQHPFRFDSNSVKPGVAAPVEDEETKKKREEEAARVEAERAAEEERRRQEEAALYEQRKELAMQIVAIGFPLHHAMRALAAVEYNVEAAVNWALEHEAEPEEEPAAAAAAPAAAVPAPAAPAPAAAAVVAAAPSEVVAVAAASLEGLSKSQSSLPTMVTAAEDRYNPKFSRSFWMEDCFAYSGAPDVEGGGKKSVLSVWEETVLPEVRAFMEGEEFGSVIIEDHLQQIRNALGAGQESQAKQIIHHIFNGAGSVRFPGEGSRGGGDAAGSDVAEISLDELRIGRAVVMTSVRADCSESLQSLVGHAGIVRAWDADRKAVLLEFYDADGGLLRECWTQLSSLAAAKSTPVWNSSASAFSAGQRLLANGIRSYRCLAALHARRAVLTLLRHAPLQPGKAEELLQLAGSEHLSCDVFHPCDPAIGKAMEGMADKLRTHVAALRLGGSGIKPLEDACERLMLSASDFTARNSVTVTQAEASSGAFPVSIKGARTMVVSFAKMCFLPAGASAKMGFFADAECSDVIKVYEQGRRLVPFVVRSSELWFRLQCNAAKKGQCKFSFTVTPCVPSLVLSVWLVDFLLQNFASSGEVDFQRLFDVTLRAFWEHSAPTAQKRVLAELMARILRFSRVKTGKMWERVFAEVQSLLENDKSFLVSTYTQMLIELLVWERVPCESSKLVPLPENPPSKSAAELEVAGSKDEDLQIAISMAKALGEEEEPKPMEVDDDAAAAAAAAAAAEAAAAAAAAQEGGAGGEGEEEMDEELRLALQMSIAVPDGGEGAGHPPAAAVVAAPSDVLPPPPPPPGDASGPPPPPPPPPAAVEPPLKKAAPELKQPTLVSMFGVKVQPVNKPAPDPVWLQNLTVLARMCLVLTNRSDPHLIGDATTFYESVVQEAWKTTVSESCSSCLVMGEGLPLGCTVPNLLQAIATAAPTLPRFLRVPPVVWPETGHVWLEAVSPAAASEVMKLLGGKSIVSGDIKTVLKVTDADLGRGLSTIAHKSSRPEDLLLRKYLASRLWENGEPTKALQSCVSAIFAHFSSLPLPENASLDMQDLAAVGEPLMFEVHLQCLRALCRGKSEDPNPAAVQQILASFETRKSGSAVALTLNGFRNWVAEYAKTDTLGLWADLLALGYDWALRLSSFSVFEQAVASTCQKWTPARDAEFLDVLEDICAEVNVRGPMQLHPSLVHAEHRGLDLNPLLRGFSTADLRLRFAVLVRFNALLSTSLKFICFDSSRFKDSLGSLVSSCRSAIFRQVKMTWVFEIMNATAVEGNQPSVVIERLGLASKQDQSDVSTGASVVTNSSSVIGAEDTANTALLLQNTAFGLALQQLRGVDRSLLRQRKPPGAEPHFSLRIVFAGENVEGQGGPYRQFFTDVVNELRDRLPLLIPCPNAQSGVGKNRDRYVVCPSVKSAVALEMYEFLGVLMGCALRTGVYVNIDLAPIFWKTLVGLPLSKSDLKVGFLFVFFFFFFFFFF
jgi:hypothetical protein